MPRSEHATVAAATGARATRSEVQPPRVIDARPGLPGGRAVLGGLLIATAAIGVFLAYADASSSPSHAFVVAHRDLDAGEVISAADLRLVRGELPDPARAGTFATVDQVAGRVVLVPIASGEILQASGLTDERADVRGLDVQLTLPRDQVAVGRLKRGELVDVYVTSDDTTTLVAREVPVVSITAGRDGSLTSEREIGLVVAAPTRDVVTALVHALRTGEVTVVRAALD